MIHVRDLNIRLGKFRIKNVELKVKKGEFLILLGPTSAGKSVIIEAIAGLVPTQSGQIIVNKRDVTNLKPEHRNISICYQDYNLFPHMNVRKNICYGLRFKKDRKNPQYDAKGNAQGNLPVGNPLLEQGNNRMDDLLAPESLEHWVSFLSVSLGSELM